MQIKSQYNRQGKTYNFTYHDGLPQDEIKQNGMGGVYSFCFYQDLLVIVGHGNNEWIPPGGGIEKGETFEKASIREIKEESDMKVLHQECIGFQVVETVGENRVERQYRMFAIVEPYGEFESDPDGDILEIKLIDPKDYKEYIPWGEIGDHLMMKALEMKEKYNNKI